MYRNCFGYCYISSHSTVSTVMGQLLGRGMQTGCRWVRQYRVGGDRTFTTGPSILPPELTALCWSVAGLVLLN